MQKSDSLSNTGLHQKEELKTLKQTGRNCRRVPTWVSVFAQKVKLSQFFTINGH
jgi:hypothetical protein